MPETLNLNYYYGNEADQYSFYRIPKILLTDRRYKGVSLEAKVLYGLLLDRMGLSARNGWLDDNGRVFLYFTQEEAMAMLDCGKDKATKLFRELEGIGLIERKKQGQGHPARIYVKNFILEPEHSAPLNTVCTQCRRYEDIRINQNPNTFSSSFLNSFTSAITSSSDVRPARSASPAISPWSICMA